MFLVIHKELLFWLFLHNGEARWRPPSAPQPEATFSELSQYPN